MNSAAGSSSISSSSIQQPLPFTSKQTIAQSQTVNQNTSQMNTSSSSSNLSTDILNVSGGDAGNSNSSTKESSSSKGSSKSTSKSGSSSTKGSSKEPREPKHSKPSRNHSKDSAPSEYDVPNPSAPIIGKLNETFPYDYNRFNCFQLCFEQTVTLHQGQ